MSLELLKFEIGGSSLLVNAAAAGILLNISRQGMSAPREDEDPNANRRIEEDTEGGEDESVAAALVEAEEAT